MQCGDSTKKTFCQRELFDEDLTDLVLSEALSPLNRLAHDGLNPEFTQKINSGNRIDNYPSGKTDERECGQQPYATDGGHESPADGDSHPPYESAASGTATSGSPVLGAVATGSRSNAVPIAVTHTAAVSTATTRATCVTASVGSATSLPHSGGSEIPSSW